MVVEQDVPDVPDREVQLAEGVLDLGRGTATAVEQPQGRFQGQPCREDPVYDDVVQGLGDAVAVLRPGAASPPPGPPALPDRGSCAGGMRG